MQPGPSSSVSTGPRAASRSLSAASSASFSTPQTSRRRVEPASKAGGSEGSSARRSSTSPPSRVSKRAPPSASPDGERPQSVKKRVHAPRSSTPYTTLSIPVIIPSPPLRTRSDRAGRTGTAPARLSSLPRNSRGATIYTAAPGLRQGPPESAGSKLASRQETPPRRDSPRLYGPYMVRPHYATNGVLRRQAGSFAPVYPASGWGALTRLGP